MVSVGDLHQGRCASRAEMDERACEAMAKEAMAKEVMAKAREAMTR